MSERDLWAAVVLQAKADLEFEPYDSIDYSQSVAFFTAGGEWAASRQAIADQMALHPDDLLRLGRAALACRHLADGPPPPPPAPPPRKLRLPEPLPPCLPPVEKPALRADFVVRRSPSVVRKRVPAAKGSAWIRGFVETGRRARI